VRSKIAYKSIKAFTAKEYMNPWVEHVLKEAARLAISYVSALVDERVKSSYKAKKAGKPASKPKRKPSSKPASKPASPSMSGKKKKDQVRAL
jgi:hypothetical protein